MERLSTFSVPLVHRQGNKPWSITHTSLTGANGSLRRALHTLLSLVFVPERGHREDVKDGRSTDDCEWNYNIGEVDMRGGFIPES